MNYGKRSTSKKRNALISRTSMLEKKSTRFVYPGFIYSSDRSLRHGCLPWYRLLPGRDRRST